MKTEQLSPLWVLVAVLALMFCAEEALVYALDSFLPQTISRQAWALINAGALSLIMAPLIWWLVMRPLKRDPMSDAAMAKPVAGAATDPVITMDGHSSIEPFKPAAEMMSGYAANETISKDAGMPTNERHSGEYGSLADVAQRKAAEERIRRLTSHDNVTGLADRQLLYQCLGEDIAAAKRDHKELALIYLSLARFKHANPALGHHAADQVLATVGERIRYQARRSDMVAQMRGDEFAVIMANGASRRNAVEVSERIVSALSKPYYLDGQKQPVQVGSSIGIAIFPADAQDADDLVKTAYAKMEMAQ